MTALPLATARDTTLPCAQFAARKRWEGWAVGLANQALWLAVTVTTEAWGLLARTVTLTRTHTRALIAWRRDPHATHQGQTERTPWPG